MSEFLFDRPAETWEDIVKAVKEFRVKVVRATREREHGLRSETENDTDEGATPKRLPLTNSVPETPEQGDLLWFRGVPKLSYALMPSLFRHENGKSLERKLFNLYTNSLPSALGAEYTDWQILFHMQHFGVPTRFLDWTESLGVAVFFALRSGEVELPCIYILPAMSIGY